MTRNTYYVLVSHTTYFELFQSGRKGDSYTIRKNLRLGGVFTVMVLL